MFREISSFLIFGKPLIMYPGILTMLTFLFTASIAVINLKGIRTISFRWHPRCAAFAIFLALVHGLLGMLAYF
jgi:hypothetical protein